MIRHSQNRKRVDSKVPNVKKNTSPYSARGFLELLLLAGLYFGAAKLGLSIAFEKTNASPVWPATGIALAAVLLLGYRIWPGITIGAFSVNAVMFIQSGFPVAASVLTAAGIAMGNTAEAVFGAFLILRFIGKRHFLDQTQNVLKFIVFAAMLATTVSATIGITSVCLGGMAGWGSFGYLWWTWWTGDAIGAIVVAPFLIIWVKQGWCICRFWRLVEAAFLFGLLIFVSYISFKEHTYSATALSHHMEYLAIPIIVWTTFRFRQWGATAATLILASIAVWYTVHGLGPFQTESQNNALLLLQTYVGVVVLMALTLASVLHERLNAETALMEARDDLDLKVKARTEALQAANRQLRDEITERKQVEQALESSLKLIKVMEALSIDELIQFALDEGARITGSKIGFFHFVNPDQKTIRLKTWSKETLKTCAVGEKESHYPIEKAGVWVDCIHQKQPVIHNDYKSLPHKKGLPEGHVPVVRELVIPIIRDDHVVAVYGVGNRETDYDQFDIDRLSLLSENTLTVIMHKQAEEALRESEEKYRALYEGSSDGFVRVDMDGNIKEFNQAYKNMTGYSKEELLKKTYMDLTPPEWHAKEIDVVKTQILKTGHSDLYEKEYMKKDGTICPIELRGYLIQDKKGNPEGMWAFVRDITERRRAEKERESLISELQKALNNIKKLRGLLPICASCKKIRDDKGYWNQIEAYIETHSDASFSHGICPECADKLYGSEDWYTKRHPDTRSIDEA